MEKSFPDSSSTFPAADLRVDVDTLLSLSNPTYKPVTYTFQPLSPTPNISSSPLFLPLFLLDNSYSPTHPPLLQVPQLHSIQS